MPTPQEAADILRRFFGGGTSGGAGGGALWGNPDDVAPPPLDTEFQPWTSDADVERPVIAAPRKTPRRPDRVPLDPNQLSDADFEQQVIDASEPRKNPRRTDLVPLDTNRLPPSFQSDDDFEQQVIAASEPRKNPRTFPYPIFDPSNSFRTDPPVRVNPLDTNRWPEASVRMPTDANSGRLALARQPDPPMDPKAAADILRTHFGMVRSSRPGSDELIGDPSGALALDRQRSADANDLATRVAREAPGAAMPVESFVQGDPGRRQVTRPFANQYITDAANLAHVQDAMAADPFTGTAEHDRVGKIQSAIDAAMTAQRPEVDDAARAVARRNAFAEYMKNKGLKMGEYEAAGSPEAYAAGLTPVRIAGSAEAQGNKDADLVREQRKLLSPSLVPGQMLKPGAAVGSQNPNDYTSPPSKKPISAADEKSINAMRGLSHMVGDLKSMLNPTDNSVTNKAAQTLRLGLYNMGVSPDLALVGGDARSQARIQLADLIKVMGASPFMAGSRNYQYMKDIYRHLTNPGATDAFLYKQLNELEKRWPQIHQAIIQTHEDPAAPLDFSPTGGGETPDESTAPDVASQLATDPTPEEKAAAARRR